MRYLYTFLFLCALPFILARLLWRSLAQPEYRCNLAQRFGFTHLKLQNSIWVHAVSVGEVIAAIPLIKRLHEKFPSQSIVVTTMTPTGAERVKQALGEVIHHLYIPYDLPWLIDRFLNNVNPKIAVIMETELWPNLLAACHARNVPIYLINARLSQKSANGYAKIAGLTRQMLTQISLIAAHGSNDADRFIKLGAAANKVVVTGNIKFDLQLPPDLKENTEVLRKQLGQDRFIWIAASTHEGEEEIIFEAHAKLCDQQPNALLILVPRHPNRFASIYKLASSQFITKRRSLNEIVDAGTQVYLGDTMGELLLLYGVADVAFVAGSLIPRGGHNMLEPGALGKAIVTGPHLFNFAEISELFFSSNSLKKVENAEELAAQLIQLRQPELRATMGKAALQVVAQNRGALAKQFEIIAAALQT